MHTDAATGKLQSRWTHLEQQRLVGDRRERRPVADHRLIHPGVLRVGDAQIVGVGVQGDEVQIPAQAQSRLVGSSIDVLDALPVHLPVELMWF